jgi:hypothetical protein
MSRKNIIYDFRPIVAGDLSLASINGTPTTVAQHDTVTYKLKWFGGQVTNGNLSIESSDDLVTWSPLDFGATINTDGATGEHRFIINEIGFKYLRPVYTRTNAGATGALEASVFASNKGG